MSSKENALIFQKTSRVPASKAIQFTITATFDIRYIYIFFYHLNMRIVCRTYHFRFPPRSPYVVKCKWFFLLGNHWSSALLRNDKTAPPSNPKQSLQLTATSRGERNMTLSNAITKMTKQKSTQHTTSADMTSNLKHFFVLALLWRHYAQRSHIHHPSSTSQNKEVVQQSV